MAMNCMKSLRSFIISKEAFRVVNCRTFSTAGGKAKKGSKGGANDAPKASILRKEVKYTTVVGANILKDGLDLKIVLDSEYPDRLWHLLDKKPPFSELRRKNIETLPYALLSWITKLGLRKIMLSRSRIYLFN
uniref:Large ribosomal subunit protein mL54 n=1 Tax=Nelumbo nucifera TaxID=4432 RepID=A0A822XX54_NELNU|nr:TPA_asm: hypothetical protein HUJ06_026056 [Nelumbo nucifera]